MEAIRHLGVKHAFSQKACKQQLTKLGVDHGLQMIQYSAGPICFLKHNVLNLA